MKVPYGVDAEQEALYTQLVMSGVVMLEKELVDTVDPVWQACRRVAESLNTEAIPYVSPFDIRKAFKTKHGMGPAKFREAETGVTNGEVIRKTTEEKKADALERAKRLLTNTYLSIGDIGWLSGLGGGSAVSGAFRRLGETLTPSEYRARKRQHPSVYSTQPMNRKRVHLNGGMRLMRRSNGRAAAYMKMVPHLPEHQILVSVTIQALSFQVSGFVQSQRLSIPNAVVLKTPFLENVKAANRITVPLTLADGSAFALVVQYDFDRHEISIETEQHAIGLIEMTLQLVTTTI